MKDDSLFAYIKSHYGFDLLLSFFSYSFSSRKVLGYSVTSLWLINKPLQWRRFRGYAGGWYAHGVQIKMEGVTDHSSKETELSSTLREPEGGLISVEWNGLCEHFCLS